MARAWARSAVAEMHAGFVTIRDEMSMNIGLRVELPRESVGEALVKELQRLDELWEEGLGRFGGPWLAGEEFGAVDAFYAPVVLRLQTFVGADSWLGEESRECECFFSFFRCEARRWAGLVVADVEGEGIPAW